MQGESGRKPDSKSGRGSDGKHGDSSREYGQETGGLLVRESCRKPSKKPSGITSNFI